MNDKLGRSIYLSLYRKDNSLLDEIPDGSGVFVSLHMEEEQDDNYNEEILKLCKRLHEKNCQVIADISKHTLAQLNTDIKTLVRNCHLYAVRTDYGFSPDEMADIAKDSTLVLNASTMPLKEILKIREYGNVLAMHNFYPRKETGLDEDHFLEINRSLKENNIKVLAFIPGKIKRGPLYEGLPTLEKQRFQNVFINYVEMRKRYDVDQVFLSEPGLDEDEKRRIVLFEEDNIITLPVDLDDRYRHLLGNVYTNRIDSPSSLIRIRESREYSRSNGSVTEPDNTVERKAGLITIDNSLYKRYCGELQITKKDYPWDEKVNVIGRIKEEYLDLLKLIERGDRFIMEK